LDVVGSFLVVGECDLLWLELSFPGKESPQTFLSSCVTMRALGL